MNIERICNGDIVLSAIVHFASRIGLRFFVLGCKIITHRREAFRVYQGARHRYENFRFAKRLWR